MEETQQKVQKKQKGFHQANLEEAETHGKVARVWSLVNIFSSFNKNEETAVFQLCQ